MQNATQVFTLTHGLLSLNISIQINYKDEELYRISMNELDNNTLQESKNIIKQDAMCINLQEQKKTDR